MSFNIKQLNHTEREIFVCEHLFSLLEFTKYDKTNNVFPKLNRVPKLTVVNLENMVD